MLKQVQHDSFMFLLLTKLLIKTQRLCLEGSHPTQQKSPFRDLNGGGGGIRTHGTLARTTVFKTAPINRSGTPPVCIIILIKKKLIVKY